MASHSEYKTNSIIVHTQLSHFIVYVFILVVALSDFHNIAIADCNGWQLTMEDNSNSSGVRIDIIVNNDFSYRLEYTIPYDTPSYKRLGVYAEVTHGHTPYGSFDINDTYTDIHSQGSIQPYVDAWIDELAGRDGSCATPGELALYDIALNGDTSPYLNLIDTYASYGDGYEVGWDDYVQSGQLDGYARGPVDKEARRAGVGCITSHPVEYFSGRVMLSASDLAGTSLLGHTRTYHNQTLADYNGPNGHDWVGADQPYVTIVNEDDVEYYAVAYGPGLVAWFDKDTLEPRYDEQHISLTHDGTNGKLIFTLYAGNESADSRSKVDVYEFQDFDQDFDIRGLLIKHTDSSGLEITVPSGAYANGQITELRRDLTDGGQERIEYEYYDNTSDNESRYEYITFSRLPSGLADEPSNWVKVSRAAYDYYVDTDDDGSLNDLKSVTRQLWIDSAWQDVDVTFYRYWKDGQTGYSTKGFEHGLKYVVGPAAYQRMVANSISDPIAATDTQVATYADNYFEYDPTSHCATREVAHNGCAGCGGSGSIAGDYFAYYDNPNYPSSPSDIYNTWKRRTTITHQVGDDETDGDEFIETIYMNVAGQVMMRVYEDEAASRRWANFYKYDSTGRLILAASPTAVDLQANLSTHEAYDDLLHDQSGNYQYLLDYDSGFEDNEGLILLTEYDDTRGGQVKNRKVMRGEGGSTILLSEYEYADLSGENAIYEGAPDLYPLTKIKTYTEDDNSTYAETSFSYGSWYESGTQFESRTTTLPDTSSQNGPSSTVTVEEEFDEEGNLIWLKDAQGITTYREYRADLNLLTMQIRDVKSGGDGLPGSGPDWTLPGSGKHVITEYEYDDLGRLTRTLGAEHEAEVSTGTADDVRLVTRYAYLMGDEETDDEVRMATGYDDGSSETLLNPVQVIKSDKGGQATESITLAVSGLTASSLSNATLLNTRSEWRSWSVTARDESNHISSIHTYHSIPSSGYGAKDTNYLETLFGYDSLGRQSRIVGTDGTITRQRYDGRGRLVEVWVGTDDVCDCGDWDPESDDASGHDMVLVVENSYDDQDNLTQVISHVDASTTRTVSYGYDWRNRRVITDGEEDAYTETTYDNLDRAVQVDALDTNSSGNLVARSETKYDDLGHVYQETEWKVDPDAADDGYNPDVKLMTNYWHDAAGNVIKTQAGGTRVFSKNTYDNLGRVTNTYVGYDTDEISYGDVDDITGDTVISQVETEYDDAGHVLLTTRYDRRHDAAENTTGALDTSSGHRTYQADWYDGLGRQIAAVDYGTNGGSSLTRPSTMPTSSDTILVTQTAYNDAGRAETVTDPAGIATKTIYDDASRITCVIENYLSGATYWDTEPNDPKARDADVNRITATTYDVSGQVGTITAIDPDADGSTTDNQVTKYVYGVTDTESGLNSNSLLRRIIYPDSDDTTAGGDGSDGIYDRVELTYNRIGETISREDQREVIHAYDYDGLGRLIHDRVTSLGRSGENVDGAVRRISRTYEVRGLVESIASYDNATVGSGSVLNEVVYAYNDFGQLVNDYQEHDGAKDGSTLSVGYGFADGTDATEGTRLQSVTYPNDRDIYYLYSDSGDTSGISDKISRVTSLSTASTRGNNDVNVIASYEYLGSDAAIRKDYPTPQVRLDYTDATGDPYDTSLDQFGRVIQHPWINDAGQSEYDLFRYAHEYDRRGNRLYSDRAVYGSHSEIYAYDNLRRLQQHKVGKINASQDGIIEPWRAATHNYSLDQLGNQAAIETNEAADYVLNTSNAANEYTGNQVQGSYSKDGFHDVFDNSSTASDWEKPGSGDAFDVDTTAADCLVMTNIAADNMGSYTEPEARGIVLLGENIGAANLFCKVMIPNGAGSGEAGLVFGYQSADDYWLRVLSLDGYAKIYHVVDGAKELITSVATTVSTGSFLDLYGPAQTASTTYLGTYNFSSGGYPSGRVGLYSNIDDVQFAMFYVYGADTSVPMTTSWTNLTTNNNASYNHISASNDKLLMRAEPSSFTNPIFLKDVRSDRYRVIFSIVRGIGDNHYARILLNGTSFDDYDSIYIYHRDSQVAPTGREIVDGQAMSTVTETRTPSAMPELSSSDTLWVRLTVTPWYVRIRCVAGATEPTNWGSTDCYYCDDFDMSGGLFGILTGGTNMSVVKIDNLKFYRWNDATSDYDILEHSDSFDVDANGYRDSEPENDAAGNLTYDGTHEYTYDAWNRLVAVAKAYRDPTSGDIEVGSVMDSNVYDGTGRRIVKSVQNAANLNGTYHYYYNGSSLVELRNGSDMVLKQYVWGLNYVDELVQIGVNDDPADGTEDDVESFYWTLQDAHDNVVGVVDDAGDLVERYEYTPYGERQVYFSAGSNDLLAMSPTLMSKRIDLSGTLQPYGLCEFGPQGLYVDDESGLVNNRRRIYHPGLGRFVQRDPSGYPDGLNLYAGYHFMLMGVDPWGLESEPSSWFWEDAWSLTRGLFTEPTGDVLSQFGHETNKGYGDPVGAVKEVNQALVMTYQREGLIQTGKNIATLSVGSTVRGVSQGAMDAANKATNLWDSGVGLAGWAAGQDVKGLQLGEWSQGILVCPTDYNRDYAGDMVFSGVSGLLEAGAYSKLISKAASKSGVVNKSWKNLIEGQAHASPAHKFRTYREAIQMAKSGQYERIYLNRSLRMATNGSVDSLMRPDVTGVLRNGMIDVIEVVSPSQTFDSQLMKVRRIQDVLGDIAGPSSNVAVPH